jgi:predicted phage-related endonuclease
MSFTVEQLRERQKFIGGSEVACLFGMSKYGGPRDLFLKKTMEIPDDFKDDAGIAARLGTHNEPFIKEMFQERTGLKIYGVEPKALKDYPFIKGSPDGILENGFIFEAKTTNEKSYFNDWGEPGTDEIPEAYKLQVAYYLMIFESPAAIINVLVGNREIYEYKYFRNPEIEQSIKKVVVNFWENHVLKNILPEYILPEEAIRYSKMISTDKDSSVVANDDIFKAYEELLEKTRVEKEISEQIESLKAKIVDFMHDKELLLDPLGKKMISYKESERTYFDTTRFKNENFSIYEQFIKNSKTRTFRLTK